MPISITPINNGDAVNATPIDNNYDTIVSAINSFDGSNIQAGTIPNTALLENPDNVRNEILNNYVVSGLTTATSVNLTSSVASGLAYINGKRVEKLSSTPKTFDANQVTYIDINDEGTITYTTSTSVTADLIRLSKVTTDADNITAVQDLRPSSLIVPTGTINAYVATTAPFGWLLCHGASYLRTEFPDLYAVIGTSFGSADSTHFNVPDFRGSFLRGWDNGKGYDPDRATREARVTGSNSGDNIGSFQGDTLRSHTHYISGPYTTGAGTTKNGSGIPPHNGVTGGTWENGAAAAGGNETHPHNWAVNYIIKY